MAPYEGSGGNISHEFGFGAGAVHPELYLFGTNVPLASAQTLLSGVNGINGGWALTTGAADGDEAGVAWPAAYRPGIKQDGRLREANGSLVTKARIGFPAIAHMKAFFGIIEGLPASGDGVSSILAVTGAGVITPASGLSYAGFYYASALTSNAAKWRLVVANEGNGDADANADDVLSTVDVLADSTNYVNVSPGQSPTLSLEAVYDGTVEFYVNGDLHRRAFKAINPETLYAPVLVIETAEAVAKSLGLDFFCDEYRRYYGPTFA